MPTISTLRPERSALQATWSAPLGSPTRPPSTRPAPSSRVEGDPTHRLAPLYDVISAIPYPEQWPSGVSLAMGIGGERRVDAITGRHWRAVARAVGLPPHALVDRIAELGEQVPAAIDRVIAQHDADRAAREIVFGMMDSIGAHVARCLRQL